MMFIKKLGYVCLSTGILLSGVSSVLNIENNVYADDNLVNVDKINNDDVIIYSFVNRHSFLELPSNIKFKIIDSNYILENVVTGEVISLPVYAYVEGNTVKFSYKLNVDNTNVVDVSYKIIGQDREYSVIRCFGKSYLALGQGFLDGVGGASVFTENPMYIVGSGLIFGVANEINAAIENCGD